MAENAEKLSTTALARKLHLPAQQLFATLRDYGWIERGGDSWMLTAKGEFEGGEYQQSRRYGRYVVWPSSLEQHPLLSAIESNQRITAASMRRYYPRLDARQMNRALAELGLQRHSIMGWELTDRGRALGGQQEESQNSGAYYVTWPHEIIDNPVIHRELTRYSDRGQPVLSEEGDEPDLFSSTQVSCIGIDGHVLDSPLQTRVCDWLYLAQLAHAYRRPLPCEEIVLSDFYVPSGSVYIDCWEDDTPAKALSAKLHRRELYESLQLRHIEVNSADSDNLDEVIGRKLLAFGVRY
ncbi:MAG: hypothetical protein AAGI44_19485 [Pseudomonadota bacterium]